MQKLKHLALITGLLAAGAAQAGPIITGSYDANTLAGAIAGSGITVSNATFTASGPTTLPAAAGTFTGGGASVGFDSGIVLTTGTIDCAGGTNTSSSCGLNRGGSLDRTTLAFDFTSNNGNVFFQYVFGSEEYNEYVNAGFNDQFELLLNGTNIALLPGGGGVVSIDNVNCGSNSTFYRNNSSGSCASNGLGIQYDGLTTILTASAAVGIGTHHFEFTIYDRGDNILDSGVFVKAGSFASTNQDVPEPGSLALVGLALLALTRARRAAKG